MLRTPARLEWLPWAQLRPDAWESMLPKHDSVLRPDDR